MQRSIIDGVRTISRESVMQSIFHRWGMLLAAALLVSGCASKLSTYVSHFQRWPQDAAGQTFRIAPPPANTRNALEYQTYADLIRVAIEPVGLVWADGETPPRFLVSFDYSDLVRQGWVQQWYDPYPWSFYPWWSLNRYYGGWGWGGGMGMMPSVVPVAVHENTLAVSIQDLHDDSQVFKATARVSTWQPQLNRVMPYLVRAIFDDFPGNNGQNREIKYEWERE